MVRRKQRPRRSKSGKGLNLVLKKKPLLVVKNNTDNSHEQVISNEEYTNNILLNKFKKDTNNFTTKQKLEYLEINFPDAIEMLNSVKMYRNLDDYEVNKIYFYYIKPNEELYHFFVAQEHNFSHLTEEPQIYEEDIPPITRITLDDNFGYLGNDGNHRLNTLMKYKLPIPLIDIELKKIN